MSRKNQSIQYIEFSLAWWIIPYVEILCGFAWLTGMEPDIDKASRLILRGIRVKRS